MRECRGRGGGGGWHPPDGISPPTEGGYECPGGIRVLARWCLSWWCRFLQQIYGCGTTSAAPWCSWGLLPWPPLPSHNELLVPSLPHSQHRTLQPLTLPHARPRQCWLLLRGVEPQVCPATSPQPGAAHPCTLRAMLWPEEVAGAAPGAADHCPWQEQLPPSPCHPPVRPAAPEHQLPPSPPPGKKRPSL